MSLTIFNWRDKRVRKHFQNCLKYNDIVGCLITIHTITTTIMAQLCLVSNKVFYVFTIQNHKLQSYREETKGKGREALLPM